MRQNLFTLFLTPVAALVRARTLRELTFAATLIVLAFPARAQVTHDFGLANNFITQMLVTASSTVTNVIGTNTYTGSAITNAVRDLALYQNAAAMLTFTPMEANGGTNTLVCTFARSLDSVTYETTPTFGFGVTIPATTNAVALATNLSDYIGPWPYVKLVSVLNGEVTTALTNVSLKLVTKRYLR